LSIGAETGGGAARSPEMSRDRRARSIATEVAWELLGQLLSLVAEALLELLAGL
jgi:hypothetical protein